jgi:two-component system, NarL family, invasion response regulator UvrY
MAKIALADDHVLIRTGLAGLLLNNGHNVLLEADNGKELISKLDPTNLPEVVLMDINMPEMDGCEATKWLRKNYPAIKVLALSMYNSENAIIRMLKCGAKGYLLKDSKPRQLESAIQTVLSEGFHYSELVSGKLINALNKMGEETEQNNNLTKLSEKEMEFLRLSCSELTYKEIAEKIFVSPRTVDNYRDSLFEKLNVKTRVGLVMYAVKNGIVEI